MSDPAEGLTRRLLLDAGLSDGMRVLDIGCGRGDVSFLAAPLVGDRGQIVGVDSDDDPLAAARERARELGLANVRFERADLASLTMEDGSFDAIVGRRVLMYQADAVAALSSLAGVLAPGGLIVLQEHDSSSMPVCLGDMPLHRRVHGWLWETVAREGADIRMGLRLGPSLKRAGFVVKRVRAEATLLTQEQPHTVSAIVRALLERIEAAGVANAAEIGIETLDERLAAELRETDRVCVWELVFGAWARKPG